MLYNLLMETLLNVPNISSRTRISRKVINQLAAEIVTRFHPKKIILFGSYAYGTPTPESDVDVLVVMETKLTELEQASQICRAIPYRFGVDLLVYTPEHLAQRLQLGDPFLTGVNKRGITLYESIDS